MRPPSVFRRLAPALLLAASLYGVSTLVLAPDAAAQCYPGLPCAEDTPQAPAEPAPAPATAPAPRVPAETNAAQDVPSEAPPDASAQRCYVDDVRPPDDWLALRTEPNSRAGRQLRRLRKGQQFELTGDFRGQWYEVRMPDGEVGWVSWQVSRWIAC